MNWKKRGYVLCCICFLLFLSGCVQGGSAASPSRYSEFVGLDTEVQLIPGSYSFPLEESLYLAFSIEDPEADARANDPMYNPLEEKYSREPAVLEKQEEDGWYQINLPEGTYEDYAGSRDVASLGKPKAYLEMRFEVNEEYTAKLRPGEYRLVKEYGGETLAAYFTLTEAPNDGTSSTSSSASSGQEDDMTDGVMEDSSVAGYGNSEDSSASSGQEGDMANGVMEDPSVAGDGSSEDSSVPMASGVRGDE